jgi:ATP-dependent RNA helicase SUPV3L1/SUV3
MKDLDQPSRASLRKYGVRFGAYHIYVPPLLKPAARALASLLWAQKQDNVDMSALSGAQHLAGSGRTSFPVDKLLDRDAYRVLGYHQCGERAVRVDILERLADLIRPALSWREASPGAKPAGAFDGRSFVVTQAMTSLTGSAGEDFASILRALGYRMEKRPPLPPKPAVVETPAAEAVAAEAAAAEVGPETASETAAEAAPADTEAVATEPVVAAAGVDEPAAVEAQSVEVLPEPAASAEPEAAVTETPQQTVAVEATAEPSIAADAAPVEASAVVTATPDAAVAPELVEVWRPGGRSEERRPRHDRNRHRHQDRPQVAQEGAAPVAATGEAADGAKRERHGRGRRERNKDFRKPRTDAPVEANAAAAPAEGAPIRELRQENREENRDDKSGRPPRERFQGKGRDGKGQDNKGRDNKGRDGRDKGKFGGGRDKGGRDGRSGGGPSHRQYASSAPPRERERPIDPNSPFAKLAALKEQLTANRKDR